MEFIVGDTNEAINAEIVHSLGKDSILIKINEKEHSIKLLKSARDEFEFILDNSFHHAKMLRSTTAELVVLIDGQSLQVKRHSKLTEVLEKSLSLGKVAVSQNNLTSQIPGRVVSVVANIGSSVKKGDSVVILESMKMQLGVKAHKDGTIKEIKVQQGSTVARNDIIATIE